ncbi:MAG: hypothetical protein RIQ93_100 [Verrucomicrobiota bacterium]
MTGYSVMVKVNELGAATLTTEGHQDIARAFDTIAPPAAEPGNFRPEPNMRLVNLACDVFVAGGGMAGVCAAISAARNGAKVVLCQDRSRLGGNASSEVKMHMVGADESGHRPGWRDSGLIEELRLDDAVNNPHRSWELWDLLLYDKCKSEANLTLLLDSPLFAAKTAAGRIQEVMVRCDKTEHLYNVKAHTFIDATGDSRLALEAGADLRWGREAQSEFNETLAQPQEDRQTLGSTILFTARNYGKPVPFTPPKWARQVFKEDLRLRPVTSWEYGYWWIEWGGKLDTIRDNERIRFELLSIVMGVWDYIKNSGDQPTSENWGLDWVGMIPGKREARRVVGDHILTQGDLLGANGDFADAVAIGGWPMDDHPPGGFDAVELKPAVQIYIPEVYNIPLRSLYSRKVGNLMMAGRNISASHVAFTSTRVMATCAVIGQAAGTAAALAARHGLSPRELAANPARLGELQQRLLRDDQTIKHCCNADPNDLARQARITASSEDEGSRAVAVLNGVTRDRPGKFEHCWAGKISAGGAAWLQLAWDQPQSIGHLQVTFDTGFQRILTLTSQDAYHKKSIRGVQPETVKDYEIVARDPQGKETTLVRVTGNYQRINRHTFKPVVASSVRLKVTATNGVDTARIYEVRCYATA